MEHEAIIVLEIIGRQRPHTERLALCQYTLIKLFPGISSCSLIRFINQYIYFFELQELQGT